MNIKIIQPAGFGDIFFTVKIGKRLIELGHTVYWPTIEEYSYAKDYMVGDINWCEPPNDDFVILDLGQASHLMMYDDPNDVFEKVMDAKYEYANMLYEIGDSSDWQDYLQIKRNYEKEEELCEIVLKDIPTEFVIANRFFATEVIPLDIIIESDLPMVDIRKIDGFTLFDWCGVFEKATEIRIPDSSFPYLVEILDTTDNLYLYNRNTEPHIRTKKIWKKNWRFVE